jgi:hypothetical protein
VRLVVKPLSFVLGLVLPHLNAIGTLAALLIDVTRVKGLLHDFNVLNVLQIELADHLFEF